MELNIKQENPNKEEYSISEFHDPRIRSIYATFLRNTVILFNSIDPGIISEQFDQIYSHIDPQLNLGNDTFNNIFSSITVFDHSDFGMPENWIRPQSLPDPISQLKDPSNILPPGVLNDDEIVLDCFVNFFKTLPIEIKSILLTLYPSAELIISDFKDDGENDYSEISLARIEMLRNLSLLRYAANTGAKAIYPRYIFEDFIKGSRLDGIRKEHIERMRTWTPEFMANWKSSHWEEPSSDLTYSVQIPVYEEFPNSSTGVHDLGNVIYSLISFSEAALKSGKPGKIEIIYNVNNSVGQTKIDPEGNTIGTEGNMRTIDFLNLINDTSIPPEEIIHDMKIFSDVGYSQEPSIDYLTQAIIQIREAIANGMQVHYIDSTDGSFIAVPENPNNDYLLPRANLASHRQLMGFIAQRRLSKSNSYGPKYHLFLDADSRLLPEAIIDLDEAIAKGLSPDLILAPFHCSYESSNIREQRLALLYNEFNVCRSIQSLLINYHYQNHIRDKTGDNRVQNLLRAMGFSKRESPRGNKPYDYGIPWKGSYFVSNTAYILSGGWNGFRAREENGDYAEYNEDGDLLDYQTFNSSGILNYQNLYRPITSNSMIPRPEAGGGKPKWWNDSTTLYLNRDFIVFFSSQSQGFFNNENITVGGINSPQEFISLLYDYIQLKYMEFTNQEKSLVESLFPNEESINYPETFFGNKVLSSPLLNELYPLLNLFRALCQVEDKENYPKLLRFMSLLSRIMYDFKKNGDKKIFNISTR